MSDIDNNNAINISTYKEKDAVKDLMRRIEATYRIHINAAQRLRDKYNHDKMLNLYYSTLITAISILTIGLNINLFGISL